jgi:hypothetical protein
MANKNKFKTSAAPTVGDTNPSPRALPKITNTGKGNPCTLESNHKSLHN